MVLGLCGERRSGAPRDVVPAAASDATCPRERVGSMAWSFPAVDATSSPWPRRLDGNLTHCLISTQTPTKSKPKDSWTRVRCRLAHDEGATGATRDEAGATASATSKAALLAILLSWCWLPVHSSAAPWYQTLPAAPRSSTIDAMMCVKSSGLGEGWIRPRRVRRASSSPRRTAGRASRLILLAACKTLASRQKGEEGT